MASLLTGTTIGGNTALHTGNYTSLINLLQPTNLGGAVLCEVTSNIGNSTGYREATTFIDGSLVQAHVSTGNGNVGACYQWHNTENIKVNPEKDYEFSYWVKSDGADNIYFGWNEYNSSGTLISSNPYFASIKLNTNGTWIKRVARLKNWRTTSGNADTVGVDRYASTSSQLNSADATDGVMHSTTASVHLRFGTCYGSTNGSKTYFHLASIRETVGHTDLQQRIILPYHNGTNYTGSMRISGIPGQWGTSGIDLIGATGEFRMSSDTGSLNLRVNGSVLSASFTYGSIFYDYNDTTYYLDPAATGLSMRVAGAVGIATTAQISSGKLSVYAGGSAGVGWGTGLNIGDTTNYTGFIQDGGTSRWRNFGTGGYDWWSSNGTQRMILSDLGALTVNASVRSPIFYDSDDTGYYIDAASTSVINVGNITKIISDRHHDSGDAFLFRVGSGAGVTRHINLADTTDDPSTNTGGTGISWGARTDNNPYYLIYTRFYNNGLSTHNRLAIAWHTGIEIGAYSDFGGIRFFNNAPFNGSEIFSVGKGDNHVRVNYNLYTPVLYDTDDTAYYLNPANTGTSLLTAGKVGITTTSADTNLQVVGHVHIGNKSAFNNTGGWDKTIYLDGAVHARLRIVGSGYSGGKTSSTETNIWVDNSASPYSGLSTGADGFYMNAPYVQTSGSFRAPLFYDSDDTGYYVDAAGTSSLSTLSLAGTLQFGGYINWNHGTTTELGRRTISHNLWQGGKKLYADEDFNSGNNSISVYNNNGGAALTITRTNLATAPNSSGYILRVSYTPGSNGTSPGFGGFFFATATAANKVLVTRFTASIPTGRTVNFHSNAYGTNANAYWLTNNAGTGKWEEYAFVVMCGNTGSFSTTNFFALSGGSDVAFTWDIASATVFDVTNRYEMVSRVLTADLSVRAPIFYDTDDTNYYLNAAATSNINTVTGVNYYASSWFRNNTSGAGLYNEQNGNHFYSDSADYWNITSPNAQVGLRLRTGGHGGNIRGWVYADTGPNVGFLDSAGNWRARVVNDDYFLISGTSVRAPLFYDSNDTNYYCDPASTSVFSTINHFAINFYGGDTGIVYSSYNTSASSALQFRILHNAGNVKLINHRGFLILNENGNNVGIGTTNPASNFHVTGVLSAPGDTGIFEIGNVARKGISFGYDNSTSQGWIYCRDVGVASRTLNINAGSLYVLGGSYAYSPYSLRAPVFYDTDDTNYYLNPAGSSVLNVLSISQINNLNAAVNVWHVSSDGKARLYFSNNGSTYYGTFNSYIFRNASDTGVVTIDASGNLRTTTNGDVFASYSLHVTGTGYASTDFRSPIIYDSDSTTYYLDPANATTSAILNGKVGIGTTSPSASYKLDVNGGIHYTSSTASSDVRFKKNIVVIDNALNKLESIRGVRYEWNEFINSRRDGYKLNEPTLGVIAQEVETVFPELVTTWDLSDDCHDAKGVNYEKFVPVLIQAIKELKLKNESLEARILTLEQKFK